MNTDKIYAEQLASEYAPKDTSKIVALRKLDRRAKLPAEISAYSVGIISTLILGLGICLAMGVIGLGNTPSFIVGIVIGLVGIFGIVINYPLYLKLLASGKKKYAYEIVELAKEISE